MDTLPCNKGIATPLSKPTSQNDRKPDFQNFEVETASKKDNSNLTHQSPNQDLHISKDKVDIEKIDLKAKVINDNKETNPLDMFSLNGQSAELEQNVVKQVPILGNIALKGQSTILYAAPNSGKTLITVHLLTDAISNHKVDASNVYYLNMDDTGQGLLEKLRIAEEYGFHMLADGYNDFKVALFLEIVDSLVEKDNCHEVIIILDTLKKFVDLMDKARSSKFSKVIRRFVLKGGSLIALAHTNKKPDSNGNPVYGGTSDIVDDCDCAYTIAKVNAGNDDKQKVVEFNNIKRRGNVVQNAAYRYSIEDSISYNQLLASVTSLDSGQLHSIKATEEIKSDADVITIIKSRIQDGVNTKMRLADAVAESAGISKRIALYIIDKYTGEDVAIHQWNFVVRERGAKVYQNLAGSTIKPDLDDCLY